MKPRLFAAAAALGAVLLLGACSAPAADTQNDPEANATSEADTGADDGAEGESAVAGEDACALVPSDQLAAAVGADPVEGAAADGEQGLKQCTWTFSDMHVVIAQYSDQADQFFPDGVWPQTDDAQPIPGATRGFADATNGTLLVVSGNQGVLVNDIDPGGSGADPAQWTALGEAILARL